MKYFHPKKAIRLIREFICFDLPFYLIPDKCYLSWKYKQIFHRPIDWKNPQTFSEKLNWLKVYDRKPIYHDLVDKLRVKPIVADLIGSEYIIPTIAGSFKSVDEIDIDQLPNQFVLKCNHDSASVIVCRDKAHFDWDSAKMKLSACMSTDYYKLSCREWTYKDIDRCIFVEQYVEDDKYDSLSDYKLYCFNGVAKGVYVTINRFTNLSVSMYDMDWNLMPFEHIHPNKGEKVACPKHLDLMKKLAEKIARFVDNPYVRVDFYETNGKVYFGEITFYPESGMCYFKPEEWDYTMGRWMDISKLQKK